MLNPEQLENLYRDALVWDNNLSWALGGYGDAAHLIRFKKSGVKVVAISVFFRDIEGIAKTFRAIASVFADCKKHKDEIMIVKSVDDIMKAKTEDKIATFMTFQETLPFEENLDLIQLYYNIGVKQALLAYNSRNSVADGCAESSNAGLSNFGKMVVKEMNEVGMIIDGAHSGYKSTMEAMDLSTHPFIFSHTNVYNLYEHYRNVRDDQIKACASTGGVIGITGSGDYMGEVHPNSETIFQHVDYIAQMVGAEHVGFGLDYVLNPEHFFETGVYPFPHRWPMTPAGKYQVYDFLGPEYIYGVVELMNSHGYSEKDIRNVLGDNFLRVAKQTWK
ncbi:MAG: peptidase M19 [Chloroflexi bacterium HGW-Chloroflexi-2]|jgi:membrane dipeptidase|nr:MAG: peptidase M19 [Chloroflexi bacterium HGW-Chloroflexi-2]